MSADTYYLTTALGSPGILGEAPAMTLRELLDKIEGSPKATSLIQALLLGDDLIQREALSTGQLDHGTPAVLTDAQLSGDDPLPDFLLAPGAGRAPRVVTDVIWEAYYRHVANVAQKEASAFLHAWVGYEVAMRNALAQARAVALSLEPGEYLVADDLAGSDESFEETISLWSAAKDPLEGLRVLDQARWNWLDDNDEWFTFSDDELAAYAAKLMLVIRQYRLTQASEADAEKGTNS